MKRLLLCLCFFAYYSPLFSFNCAELWRNGFPTSGDRFAEVPCTESVTFGLVSGFRLFTSDRLLGDQNIARTQANLAESINQSVQRFRTWTHVPNINVILHHEPFDNSTLSTAFALTFCK